MLRIKYACVTILCLSLWAASLSAQNAGIQVIPTPRTSPVIAQSGGYQLTEVMVQRALQLAQIEAGADFSPSDAAALRADLIAYFRKEPPKQMEAHKNIAETLQSAGGSPLTGKRGWMGLALLRYRVWQQIAQNPEWLREWQSYPFGKMVLKYNPILVNSGGMIVTRSNVDCLFYSNALVAQAAGVTPPTQAEKDQFIRTLPPRFASMPTEQKQQLRMAEERLTYFDAVYRQTIQTRAVVIADIRRNVHSPADVWREARQVEDDAGGAAVGAVGDSRGAGKYWRDWEIEMRGGILDANRVIRQQQDMRSFGDSTEGSMRPPVASR
jgi:hypothetical protein